MTGYKGGRIARIKVEDFMTYDHLEVFPKKGLNIIIGLNGSGKSSLMSAICLGLGGKPQFTGKSNQLEDFIKHGKKKASIEIELEDPEENVVIRRIIEGDKSRWSLNSINVDQNKVMAAIKKYNIDVGNLCQFLPQEKVAEFSKMDSKRRLETMIQAIGEPRLHSDFNQLKNMREKQLEMEKNLKQLVNNRGIEIQANDRLRVEVDKHEEKVKLKENLEIYKLQKKCLEYEEIKLQVTALRNNKKTLKTQLNKAENDLSKYKKENGNLIEAYNQKAVNIKNAARTSSVQTEKLSELQNQLSELHAQVDKAKIEFQNRISEVAKQKEKLKDLEKQILAYENLLKNDESSMKDYKLRVQENTDKTNKVNEEIRITSTNLENIMLEINQQNYKSKAVQYHLEKLNSQQNQQMKVLQQRCRDTHEAACWLLANQNKFKSEICMPALLSVETSEEDYSKYIENTISIRDLKTFICTDKDDVKLLLNIFHEQKNLRVNIALAPHSGKFQPPPLTSELKSFGIECFVSDLFTAPGPVKDYLCDLYKLHFTPVGSVKAEQYTEEILSKFGKFFTPNERISGTRSRYGAQNLTIKKDFIKKRNLIQCTSRNLGQIRQLEDELSSSQQSADSLKLHAKTFESELALLEKQQEDIRRERAGLASKFRSFNDLKAALVQKTALYNSKKSETFNEEDEEKKMISKIIVINNKRMKVLQELNRLGLDFVNLKCKCAKDIIYTKVVKKELKFLEDALKTKQEDFTKLQREYSSIEERKLELLRKAQEVSNFLKTHPNFSQLATLRNHMPTKAEIEENIVKIEAQIDLNYTDNEEVIQEYRMREKQIENLCNNIENYQKKLRRLKSDIEEKKEDWLSCVLTHIDVINTKFSHYYKLLKCAGEISLGFGPDPDDFSLYGLQIRLKYRDNEPFTILSPDHHSGGERNVASILFILSLKELSTVPFRCVDEINQGMDSTNERKMYEFIAEDASKTNSCSQYFLLTPKLLKDLKYQKDVAVHIIFNSRFLEAKMNISKQLETVRRI